MKLIVFGATGATGLELLDQGATDNSLRGGSIARADVAAFMLQQVTSDAWLRKRPVVIA